MSRASSLHGVCGLLLLLACTNQALAQDLEPRRWTHLPKGLNFLGVAVAYGEGDITLDPVLQVENAKYRLGGMALGYVRSFGLFGQSARFDVLVPYASGRWEGLLEGEPVSLRRRGFADARVRLSVLLYGGPAETAEEFAQSRKSATVVGAALSVRMPTGEYFEDKLINLGSNRWVIRPQIGVTHTRGKWTMELTGSVFLYTDNDEFFDGNKLENDPLYALQGHLIYTFRPGLWVSLSTAYGDGAEAKVNGVRKDNPVGNWLAAFSVGLPINRDQGVKLTLLHASTQEDTGVDIDSLIAAWTLKF